MTTLGQERGSQGPAEVQTLYVEGMTHEPVNTQDRKSRALRDSETALGLRLLEGWEGLGLRAWPRKVEAGEGDRLCTSRLVSNQQIKSV